VERKLATVLFADLVGSTQLVASADPEIVRSRDRDDEARQVEEALGGLVGEPAASQRS
jgi:class 3 adenylate cyclase